MVECAASDADIGLYAETASLSDVNAGAQFQKIVDGLNFRVFDVFTRNDRNIVGCFGKGDRDAHSYHFGRAQRNVRLLLADNLK